MIQGIIQLPTVTVGNLLMFKLDDLWICAQDWAKKTGRKYNYATVETAAAL